MLSPSPAFLGPVLRVCAALPVQAPFWFPFPFLCHVHGPWSVSFWTMNFHKQEPCLSNSPTFLAPGTSFMKNNFPWTWAGQGWGWFWAWGFPGDSDCKEWACNVGDPGSIPGSGRCPGRGNGNPLQYSCLEKPMDGRAWQTIVQRVTVGHDTFSLSSALHLLCTVFLLLHFDV